MPLATFPLLLALCIVVTAVSGIWLMLNARSVAALFRGRTEIVPGPGRRRASRGAVIAMLILFNLGWIGAIAVQWIGWEGAANEVIVSENPEHP
ncbi:MULTISPECIES: hypothetical protein [unclassified Sphingosinithalassobacter]|uniref:hypothetical protein n=1 Tax=unclassified Sphingosinithalassobacter TaxID=2676235 RepID=UPI00165DE246|nr:hypothetical protein [Sphingosinithalassobacter sp. CS137]